MAFSRPGRWGTGNGVHRWQSVAEGWSLGWSRAAGAGVCAA